MTSVSEALDFAFSQIAEIADGRSIEIESIEANLGDDRETVCVFVTLAARGRPVAAAGFDLPSRVSDAVFCRDVRPIVEVAFAVGLGIAMAVQLQGPAAPSALETARAAFNAKWSPDAMMQAVIEKVAGGDCASVFEELQADRETLKALARGEQKQA